MQPDAVGVGIVGEVEGWSGIGLFSPLPALTPVGTAFPFVEILLGAIVESVNPIYQQPVHGPVDAFRVPVLVARLIWYPIQCSRIAIGDGRLSPVFRFNSDGFGNLQSPVEDPIFENDSVSGHC